MDWNELLIKLLEWIIPLGGLGSIVAWFSNRTKRRIEEIKETHDAYKAMYEDLKTTLKDELQEKKLFRATVAKLERAIAKMAGCRLYPNCPVNHELLSDKTPNPNRKGGKGQRRNKGNTESDPGNDTGVEGGINDTDPEPP